MDLKRHEWFRNTSWNSETEAAFFKKLARARDKSQYLRIQACTLADRCPEVALRLLDQYFATGKHFGVAQAHVDRATAYRCLNQLEAAIVAYEAALDVDPTLSTQAYVELPFLIATERLSQHYDRAISLLEAHEDRPAWPLERFRWSCALALIRAERGDHRAAQEAARRALAALSETQSGFRYHPQLGLVRKTDESLLKQLKELAT